MAYQDWYTAASINAQGPSGALPPALVPASNSVLEEQSDPGGYTSSNPTVFNATSPSNTPVSSTNQISQIMNSINPSPLSEPQAQGTAGMGYGSAPMSWNQMSTGGPTGPSAPSGSEWLVVLLRTFARSRSLHRPSLRSFHHSHALA